MFKISIINTNSFAYIHLLKVESVEQNGYETKIRMDSGDIFVTLDISATELSDKIISLLNRIHS